MEELDIEQGGGGLQQQPQPQANPNPAPAVDDPEGYKYHTLAPKWRICVEYAARMRLNTDLMTGDLLHEVAAIANKGITTIKNVWCEFKQGRMQPFTEDIEMCPKMQNHVGKRRRDDAEEIEAGIKFIVDEAHGNITYSMISKRLNDAGYMVHPSTVWFYCQKMHMKEISNYVRQSLTDEGKMKRLRWVLAYIRIENNIPMFDNLYDVVYIDEKWFRLEQIKRKLKRFEDSPPEPHYHMQSKRHPTQVMYSVAVARPRTNPVTGEAQSLSCHTSSFHWHSGTVSIAQPVHLKPKLIQSLLTTFLRL